MPRKKKETNTPSLSCNKTDSMGGQTMTQEQIMLLNQKVFDAVSNLEMQKSLDKWLKEHNQMTQIHKRDLSVLKSVVMEYLDTFLLFGYNLEGNRVIIQNFKKAKDRDAIMEFLKTIFLKQQHENFLDD